MGEFIVPWNQKHKYYQIIHLINCNSLTKGQFLPRVRGESEAEQGHAGDEDAGHDEVEEVVERPPPDLDGEGDVHVRLRATLINDAVSLTGHTFNTILRNGSQ